MDFAPTQEQRQIREVVSEVVDEEVVPRAAEIDETDEFPADLIDELAELGLMGMPFPEEYGGAGADYNAYADALAEVARGSGGVATIVAAHVSLAGNMLYEYGSEAQKERFLEPLARGEELGAFALSEAGAGSDVLSMETHAERRGDDSEDEATDDSEDEATDDSGGEATDDSEGEAIDDATYVLNGGKLWTSNGSVADTVVVFAKTDPDAGRDGLSSFVVRPEADEGFHVEGTEHKLGDKGCPTAELRFDDLEVPAERRLGDEGDGFWQALETLNAGRITIAARGVGIAQAALDAARDYANEREQFDQPIGEFQAIQHELADMDTKLQAARMLMHRAADRKERGEEFAKEAAQAKLYASEVSREVANSSIQVHGGYGYTTEFPVERYYRDAKLNEIYEGTSEVLRNVIGQRVLEGR